MISYLWAGNGKCGVFIPYHSHQAIPIPISIPMKLAWRFPFPWESHVGPTEPMEFPIYTHLYREAAWFIISVDLVCLSVCTSVCLSVYQTTNFESLDVTSSYVQIRSIFREYRSSSYMGQGQSYRSKQGRQLRRILATETNVPAQIRIPAV